jgi:ATP-dependent helicase/nuclease subunit A
MNEFLRMRLNTAAQLSKQTNARTAWPEFRSIISTIPDADSLADYCRAVEGFRKVRPTALGNLKEMVQKLDQLVWGEKFRGAVPQVTLDLFAKQFALEMVNILTRIDERLNEEKQKLSALDFADLELRALSLLEIPQVLTRAAERYQFFLVDEFQDTNGIQRKLLERLALLTSGRDPANLFIVGDRKQSVYGFRGADVDVFREMTNTLISKGGESRPLQLNFRSRPQLINFFNYLFERLFQPSEELDAESLIELGYVAHEPSEARREAEDSEPRVELLITTTASLDEGDPKSEQDSRELDAQQLAVRIHELVDGSDGAPRFSDIALLFRAMTNAQAYESVFRRANIPYQTVLGRGFYEREEITDLIQLLRFLDNKTDELALAAVLRSPLCGISDNTLLALRCAPLLTESEKADPLRHFTQTRKLYYALSRHRDIAFIADEEHVLLDRAFNLIRELIARRHHYSIAGLLRFAVDQSEYLTITAANFDGPQRLANVHRLFTLAERFDSSGTHLVRDFVRYVEEFEAIGSRESEGQIDQAANAVRLMTIHQAKGLEFPVVIIPDLQRASRVMDSSVLLDRHHGLTLKVPDGRGKSVSGSTFNRFEQRQSLREEFESMRLLYVAATRAQERLIFSGTTPELAKLSGKTDNWLKWIWKSLGLEHQTESGLIDFDEGVQLHLTVNPETQKAQPKKTEAEGPPHGFPDEDASLHSAFPLLTVIEPQLDRGAHRFSVTQLINYQRCRRQYYFDRVLHVPSAEAMTVWNNAEAPEPPANLTATLKGAVIHRFCETYKSGEDPHERVIVSLEEVIRQRQAELADRLAEIDRAAAIKELEPLAKNYISSEVFKRVEAAQRQSGDFIATPGLQPGLWSELSFRLRRPLGVLNGIIDKLLISRSSESDSLEVEIIDFKTNRIRPAIAKEIGPVRVERATVGSRRQRKGQIALSFMEPDVSIEIGSSSSPIFKEVAIVAADYQLQMQAYALAVRTLIPDQIAEATINVTLHFLNPNVEFHLPLELLERSTCERAIDEAMLQIASSSQPEDFPVHPSRHCRVCSFLGICAPGREWLANQSRN